MIISLIFNLILFATAAYFLYRWRKAQAWECDCDECASVRYFASYVPDPSAKPVNIEENLELYFDLFSKKPDSNAKILNISQSGLSMSVEITSK